MASDIQTLDDLEIFPFYPNYDKGVDVNILGGYEVTQFGRYSPMDIVEDTADKQLTVLMNLVLTTKQEKYNFLQFMDDHKGQLKKFWLYANVNEFNLKEAIAASASTMLVEDTEYHSYYKVGDRIYFYLKTGDVIVRKVQSVTYDAIGEDITITFTTQMPAYEIGLNDVYEIGRVLCCRFDHDSFEVPNKNTTVATTKVRFLELPKEYPS